MRWRLVANGTQPRASTAGGIRPAAGRLGSCPVMESDEQTARTILESFRTFAVVGCSPNPTRDSHQVARFLQSRGYRTIPVHPDADEILGERAYGRLGDIPPSEGVEVVDIFRRSEHAGVHVDEAIAVGARAVWMQLGVVDPEAAARARDAGLAVVMNRCPAIDHPRFFDAGR